MVSDKRHSIQSVKITHFAQVEEAHATRGAQLARQYSLEKRCSAMPSRAIGASGESPKSGSARDTDRHSHASVCTHFTCLKSALFILNMVVLPPITLPSAASGVIMRLLLSFLLLM